MIKTEEITKSRLSLIWKIVRLLIPPIIIICAHAIQNTFRKATLEYAPDGWRTPLDDGQNQGWSVDSVVDNEKAKWDDYCRNLQSPGPLGFSHEHTDLSIIRNSDFHNVHISYAYVLALTAHKKDRISVLDWGGSLGHYYLLGKAVLPDVSIDYHVKEVPLMAKAGKQLNPEVNWYDDETCLERGYDLIMMNGSLLYLEDWVQVLHRIAQSVKEYLFLFRLPVVQKSTSFISIERLYHSQMLHQQLNQSELLDAVDETGLTLVREFVVGDPPYIKNAPEQCEMRGWLFKKETTSRQ
jgi:putative methyltransferase (TIGR04325 family)